MVGKVLEFVMGDCFVVDRFFGLSVGWVWVVYLEGVF